MFKTAESTATADELIAEFAEFNKHKVTIRHYRWCVNNLRKLIPDGFMIGWRGVLAHLDSTTSGMMDSTKRKRFCLVRSFLQHCVTFHGLDPRAPMTISVPPRPIPNPRVLTHQECRDVLLYGLTRSRAAAIYTILGLYFGLRRKEAIHLYRQDIDFLENCIHIRWREKLRLKTPGSIRSIPIPSCVRGHLEAFVADAEPGRLIPYSVNWPKKLAYPHRACANVMRHTYASALVSGKMRDRDGELFVTHPRPDYWQVSRLLGHAGVDTLRYYVGLSDGIPSLDPSELA